MKPRLAALLAALLASCAAPSTRASAPSPANGTLALVQQDVTDTVAREPMLVEHPSRAAFVSGYRRMFARSDGSLATQRPRNSVGAVRALSATAARV